MTESEITIEYRGHEIKVLREYCLGGWELTYFTVYRLKDGYECICNFEDSTEPLANVVKNMEIRIDRELESFNPWNEKNED